MDQRSPGSSSAATDLALTRIVVRPVATPISLGFLGLAGATFVVAGLELGWIDASQQPLVGLVLMTFTTMLQLIATIYGFLARDSVAATGMGILAGTWFSVGLVLHLGAAGKQTSGALGLLLFASATALLAPVVGALRSKVLAAIVMATTSLRFFLTGAYEMNGSSAWKTAAGWTGIALFLLAVFAALAFEIEDTRQQPLRATLRRGKGTEALAGELSDEVSRIHHEAGVRESL